MAYAVIRTVNSGDPNSGGYRIGDVVMVAEDGEHGNGSGLGSKVWDSDNSQPFDDWGIVFVTGATKADIEDFIEPVIVDGQITSRRFRYVDDVKLTGQERSDFIADNMVTITLARLREIESER
jgi:hypothetical protein